jgi:hypothetical protein
MFMLDFCARIKKFNLHRKAAEPVIVIDEMSKKVFKLINKLDHPNIIKVNYFYEDGYFYVIRTYDDDYVIKFFANKKGSWNLYY